MVNVDNRCLSEERVLSKGKFLDRQHFNLAPKIKEQLGRICR